MSTSTTGLRCHTRTGACFLSLRQNIRNISCRVIQKFHCFLSQFQPLDPRVDHRFPRTEILYSSHDSNELVRSFDLTDTVCYRIIARGRLTIDIEGILKKPELTWVKLGRMPQLNEASTTLIYPIVRSNRTPHRRGPVEGSTLGL